MKLTLLVNEEEGEFDAAAVGGTAGVGSMLMNVPTSGSIPGGSLSGGPPPMREEDPGPDGSMPNAGRTGRSRRGTSGT